MLKYQGATVVLQEVPDEISLAINISNCPYNCLGCHSVNLREDVGQPLMRDFPMLLNQYKGLITCVCFMGDGGEKLALLELIRQAQNEGLKTCLYTGADILTKPLMILCKYLDYIKIGHYSVKHGGLNCRTTNQRMYQINHGENESFLTDITEKFWRKKE